ncbi:MAG TPA: acyl-[acyl-carrier-protein]--UDP-N-acetylglucosamine O-acyltransferase [Verrucomicrobia bacterium]|jgi:UDP-N-acetylglucosamine acyltransferase|nr:acyl-[acyl-carrier-protein]--UDP-N-acetylglucosamine O-acyltransferase [Verrucomicrobiota bacterium]
MPSSHHPTAIIDPKSEIGTNVTIGPFAIIEADTVIGDGCSIGPYAVIASGTRLGKDNQVFARAMLGFPPQDIAWSGGTSYLQIGDRNIFREGITLHRGTGEGSQTTIGNDCFFMAMAHVAHNAIIGNRVILTNNVMIAGYANIQDYVVLGGGAAVHQFTRVGRMTMIGGGARIRTDIPPFVLASENNTVFGLNLVGLRRNGVPRESIRALRQALKWLYCSGLSIPGALENLRNMPEPTAEIQELITFIETSKRGITRTFGKKAEE